MTSCRRCWLISRSPGPRRAAGFDRAASERSAASSDSPTTAGVVSALADRIQEVARTSAPRGLKVHDWEAAPNAFAAADGEGRTAGTHVGFAYVAPTVAEAKELGLPIDRYGSRPEEWRPYGPTSILLLATTAAAQEKSSSEMIPIGASLIDNLRGAEQTGRLTFLLIDSAVLRFDGNREMLSQIDELTLMRFRPILVWSHRRARLRDRPGHDRRTLPHMSHDRALLQARSEAELQALIRQHLVVMRAEAIRTAAIAPPGPPGLRIPRVTAAWTSFLQAAALSPSIRSREGLGGR